MNYSDKTCALAAVNGLQTDMNDKNVTTEAGVTTVYLFGKKCAVVNRKENSIVLDGTIKCSRKSTRLFNAILSALDMGCTAKTRYGRWFIKYPNDRYMMEFTGKDICLYRQ